MARTPLPQKVGTYYTLTGAANALGISYWSVYRYVRLAGVPVTKVGHLTLVRLEDLRDLLPAPAPRGFEWPTIETER